MLPPSTLALLVCPACREALEGRSPSAIACTGCGQIYPVRDGIPILLVDEGSTPHGNEL